ncbi:hypothetical protein J2T56_002054 [Natronobacillus azotifigens]|uniref:DUF4367 domain-containing protein n=1 Tax=Natronobacillus azotifigens TaxID=472978 RepID=A0A9J6RF81_9BACI|nr:hypothetical protein [Natronobacillus azotifigens]MCZ0703833.1 hypothetical protein [Natronobacillus azotifigens]
MREWENEKSITVFAQFYHQDQELFSIHQEKVNVEIDGNYLFNQAEDEVREVEGFDVHLSQNGELNKAIIVIENYSIDISSIELDSKDLIKLIRSMPLNELK